MIHIMTVFIQQYDTNLCMQVLCEHLYYGSDQYTNYCRYKGKSQAMVIKNNLSKKIRLFVVPKSEKLLQQTDFKQYPFRPLITENMADSTVLYALIFLHTHPKKFDRMWNFSVKSNFKGQACQLKKKKLYIYF